jgi:hypothetical protein
MKENDKKVLEECVLDNTNWELPVEATVLLLLKAKEKGCESQEFLVQFYSYLQAHLDDAETEKEDIDYICNKFNLT